MKLKQQPEDFQVEELTDVIPGDQGVFAFYRMQKSGWTTPDAIQAIRRRWKVDHRRISYGGLKDRHALTVQYLTIFHGPKRQLTHHGVNLKYLGQVRKPYISEAIRANRFQLTLRAINPAEVPAMHKAVEDVRMDGVPNYFDDQRFGSISGHGEFVARHIIMGRHEDALRVALASPYEFDRAEQKREKATLLEHWADWTTCKDRLPRGHARSLVDYLRFHPTDFKGALERLRPELRGLYLSAYQSHLWNRMLARRLQQQCRPEQLLTIRLKLGEVPAHQKLDEAQRTELAELRLPLPNARTQLDPNDPRTILMQAVLKDEGLEVGQLKLKGFREMFFSKGERAALCQPMNLTAVANADEIHPGRQKVLLNFDLPRGSYATLIVKRITG